MIIIKKEKYLCVFVLSHIFLMPGKTSLCNEIDACISLGHIGGRSTQDILRTYFKHP